ncbi:MAG: hypothetical protein COB59_02015 [Rhodospirillaceae bacterium]|nr:MAG: hypothetical protein COB59_02015 [Rhodospirillaceae bacterium]
MIRIAQVLFATFLTFSGSAWAQDVVQADRDHYEDCMVLAKSHPKDALENAKVWLRVGGGFAARHCGLAALMTLKLYDEAAQGFARLGQEFEGNDAVKTSLFIQSAKAWLGANKPELARQNAAAALTIEPENAEALLNRAKAFSLLGKFWEAADDFTRVLYHNPDSTDILILRGLAYRQIGAGELALEDFRRALSFEPENTEAQTYLDAQQ